MPLDATLNGKMCELRTFHDNADFWGLTQKSGDEQQRQASGVCEEQTTGEAEWPIGLVTRKLNDGEKGETGARS